MPVNEYRVPFWRRRISRPLITAVFRGLFRLLSEVEITGMENVPLGQAYVVATNHVSTFEAPLVGGFWPEICEALGAVEVWHRPGQSILANLYGGIQVHRGEVDRQLFEAALAVLRSGRPLMIAPEGGRSHKPGMRRAKAGIAIILEEAGVPVIPVGVVGTTDDFWQKASHFKHPRVEMHIGRPFRVPPLAGQGSDRREARQRNADLVMAHIAGLLPEEYHGVYAGCAIAPAQTDQ
jgi:1-acyl-sn-glycerol-3-phosphate acyltransferase